MSGCSPHSLTPPLPPLPLAQQQVVSRSRLRARLVCQNITSIIHLLPAACVTFQALFCLWLIVDRSIYLIWDFVLTFEPRNDNTWKIHLARNEKCTFEFKIKRSDKIRKILKKMERTNWVTIWYFCLYNMLEQYNAYNWNSQFEWLCGAGPARDFAFSSKAAAWWQSLSGWRHIWGRAVQGSRHHLKLSPSFISSARGSLHHGVLLHRDNFVEISTHHNRTRTEQAGKGERKC